MRERVRVAICLGVVGAAVFGAMTLSVSQVQADDPNSAPNPPVTSRLAGNCLPVALVAQSSTFASTGPAGLSAELT